MIVDTRQRVRFCIVGFAPLDAVSVAETLAGQGHFSRILPSVVQSVELDEVYSDALILHGELATRLCCEAKSTAFHVDPLTACGRPVIILGDFERKLTTSSFVHILPAADFKEIAGQLRAWITEFERHLIATSSANTVSTAKYRVLVADDDLSMQSLVCHVLQRSVIECWLARDGRQAIGLAKVLMPDLVILDVNMPGLNGFRVLSDIRQDPGTRDASVLMLTGRNSADDITTATKLGADTYVVKPIRVYEFRTRIETLLWKREKPGKLLPANVCLAASTGALDRAIF